MKLPFWDKTAAFIFSGSLKKQKHTTKADFVVCLGLHHAIFAILVGNAHQQRENRHDG